MESEILKRVKETRESKGIKQEDLAISLGISLFSYSKLERGKTQLTINYIERIAKALGVSPYELVSAGDKDIQSLTKENEVLKKELKDLQEVFYLFKELVKGWLERKGGKDSQRSAETILEEARKIGKEIDL